MSCYRECACVDKSKCTGGLQRLMSWIPHYIGPIQTPTGSLTLDYVAYLVSPDLSPAIAEQERITAHTSMGQCKSS